MQTGYWTKVVSVKPVRVFQEVKKPHKDDQGFFAYAEAREPFKLYIAL